MKTQVQRLGERFGGLVNKGRYSFHGRASWGLQLVLEALGRRVPERVIALPSLVCHSVVTAVIAAGWRPLFCDVELSTGLVPDAEWDQALRKGAKVCLLVHLYGHVAPIARLAASKTDGVVVIEDVCQALGATNGQAVCGAFGDVSLFSFGYSKIIDVSHGGCVLSNDERLMEDIDHLARSAPGQTAAQWRVLAEEYKHAYEASKAQFVLDGDPSHLAGLAERYAPQLNVSFDDEVCADIARQMEALGDLVRQRRAKHANYSRRLSGIGVDILECAEGAAPWRFVFSLPGVDRREQEDISAALRQKGVHVSNWYLPAHWMVEHTFEATGELPNTRRLSETVFQLWLDDRTSAETITVNCEALQQVLGDTIGSPR